MFDRSSRWDAEGLSDLADSGVRRDHHGDVSFDDWVNGAIDFERFEAIDRHTEYPPLPHATRLAVAAFDSLVATEHRNRLELLDALTPLGDAEIAEHDGAPSLVEWLRMQYGWNRHTARETVRVAEALPDLPAIREAYAAVAISWDQLRAVTRFATRETDDRLAREIIGLSAHQISRLDSPAADEPAEASAFEDRKADYWFSPDEPVFRFDATLPDAEGAIVATALERFVRSRQLDPTTERFQDDRQAMADALVEMASRYLGADTDPDRATIIVSTSLETLLAASDPDDARNSARIVGGPLLTNPTLRRLACDARLQLAITGDDGTTVGVGRTTRTIPGWLRRLVSARDGGCRFPRCDRSRWVHVHHLVHWVDGGPTDLDNLLTLCGHHHRLIHNRGWAISGDPNGTVTFIRPDGTPYAYREDHIRDIEAQWAIRSCPMPPVEPPLRPRDDHFSPPSRP